MKKLLIIGLSSVLLLGGCNQKLYKGMSKREPNKEVGR